MPIPAILSFTAAYFSLIIAAVMLLRDRHAFIHRVFATGMLLLAAEEICRGMGYHAILPEDVIYWQRRVIAFSALVPGVWLTFSINYARANSQESLSRWKWLLGILCVGPFLFVLASRQLLITGYPFLEGPARWVLFFGWPGLVLQCFIIVGSILIVFNLERTLRSSIGRIRWQIKFIALGVQGLFALRIYLASQSVLFSLDTGLGAINAVALIAADLLFAISLLRGRLLSGDVYLSTASLKNSFTIILAGVYLLSVGVVARFVRYLVPSESLPIDAFIVFLSLTVLTVLLLSNRLHHRLLLFITRHFRRPIYDYRELWMELTQRTTSLLDISELSSAIAKMVSEALDVLSVNVWILDETQQRLTLAGSTSLSSAQSREIERAGSSAPDFIRFVREQKPVIDLNEKSFEWPKQIMQAGAEAFRQSTMRYAIALRAGGELVGVMTLNDDRIGDEELASEDFILVETLASDLAASLLNLKLSARLRQAGEVEAFQTVSTFFVHDLKNLASRLSLTMENLPEHFDDPEFRADALRVISGSLANIDNMCSRLSMLKRSVELNMAECDIKQLVASTLEEFKPNLKATLEPDLQPVPKALVDREQMHKVLTNLVLNANEAVNGQGIIRIATVHEGDTVGFAVKDNGCGMSQDFIEKSLFRPFQTTKNKGLGIGLFHTKLIVEAHRGKIEVSSKLGKGTEFRVVLPVA